MALSLGDVFLNFTAGAVERNNQIRDENVALALEDFKANKDLYFSSKSLVKVSELK